MLILNIIPSYFDSNKFSTFFGYTFYSTEITNLKILLSNFLLGIFYVFLQFFDFSENIVNRRENSEKKIYNIAQGKSFFAIESECPFEVTVGKDFYSFFGRSNLKILHSGLIKSSKEVQIPQ